MAYKHLERDRDRQPDARIPAVVKVVPVVIADVNIVGGIPVISAQSYGQGSRSRNEKPP
jgi:hypothetical protein